jgi:N-acetylglucosaminyldiphosphoundecaprenol N-acetyl-beta-D-mannosaminyltransferase
MVGIDLMQKILKIASEKNLSIFLTANSGGLSSWEETASVIKKLYPNIQISGVNVDPRAIQEMNYEAGIMNYEIVFCSFGVPYQEKFLHSLKNQKNGKIRLAMGVGGSFDYLTGKVRRAPVLWRQFGLEWLWRLILEPHYRFKRIFNAVIIFPIKVIFAKQ